MSRNAAAMLLRRQASEMVLEASSLTDELTDEEARPLLAWGLEQAKAAADELALTDQATAALPAEDIRSMLADQLTPVRRTMKLINGLTADRYDLSPEDLFEELKYVVELAGRLPHPPSLTDPQVPLAELTGRQADLDNAAFVQAIVALLGSSSPIGIDGRAQVIEAGEKGDERNRANNEHEAPGPGECWDRDRPGDSGPVFDADHRDPGPGSV
jgi:hypothetical protein